MAVTFPITLVDGTGYAWQINSSGYIQAGNRSEFSYAANNSRYAYFSDSQLELGGRQVAFSPYTSGDIEYTRKVYVSPREGFVR